MVNLKSIILNLCLAICFILMAAMIGLAQSNKSSSPQVINNWARLDIVFENRNRFSNGPHGQECTPPSSIPWGNWGVDSNFGQRTDGHQFDGWCKGGDSPPLANCYYGSQLDWYEWNSCTTSTCCDPPDCSYFNADNCTHQTTTQGDNTYGNTFYCWPILSGHEDEGCAYLNGKTLTFSGSYMTVYELDDTSSDDFIQTLYYPNLQQTLSNCTFDDCPGQSSTWYNVSSRNPISPIILNAQIRFRILGCVAVDDQCP